MKALIGAFAIAGVATLLSAQTKPQAEESACAHVRTSFDFVIAAPFREAAPLFGPNGERGWSGEEWDPQFLYPKPGRDIPGAVFTVRHGTNSSLWVNTVFDLEAGQFQYVSFIPDVLVTVIDVRLRAVDPANTYVEVVYTRTALKPEANQQVLAMSEHERSSGDHWQKAIHKYLESHQSKPPGF
jgi:hypothetical protein